MGHMTADTTPQRELARIVEGREHGSSGSGRRIRKRARLKLVDVAKAMGKSTAILSLWERGLAVPGPDNAILWADTLDNIQAVISSGGDTK